jgi:hypothetical protein
MAHRLDAQVCNQRYQHPSFNGERSIVNHVLEPIKRLIILVAKAS